MKPAKVTYAVGIAIVAAMAMFGSWLLAQDKPDPNAAPNPYRMLESWAQLPEGRQWGAPIGVEVDHSDGKVSGYSTDAAKIAAPARTSRRS